MKNKIGHSYFILTLIAFLVSGFLTTLVAQKQDTIKSDKSDSLFVSGKASYYANILQGSNTSSGDSYDKNDFTCAHRTLPFNTLLCVTNIANGKKVIVRVNDRGPYRKRRVIDLSRSAAQKLGMVHDGVVKVQIQELNPDNFSPLNDTLLCDGDVIDTQGNLYQLKSHFIKIWNTQDLKHAIYMAANIESEYPVECLYIKISGKGEDRKYILCIPNVEKKEDADKLITALKEDGFSSCKYQKK